MKPHLLWFLFLVLATCLLLEVFISSRYELHKKFPRVDLLESGGRDTSNSTLRNSPQAEYKIIIITKSAPDSLNARNLLREKSWMSYTWTDEQGRDISWRHFFLLGLTIDYPVSNIMTENATHGDILIAPSLDGYTRMTYKLLEGMKIILRDYRFSFLIVQSEDTMVNVKKLDEYLNQLIAEEKDRYFYGGVNCFVRPANRAGTWAVRVEEWSPRQYPPFCLGTGLIFSRDSVEEITRIWREGRELVVGLDDAHIGILVFLSAGKITMTEVKEVGYGCKKDRSDYIIVTQIQPLERGIELMKNYMEQGIYCTEDVRPHS